MHSLSLLIHDFFVLFVTLFFWIHSSRYKAFVRFFLTFSINFVVSYFFWATNYERLYNLLTNHEAYLKEFTEGLRKGHFTVQAKADMEELEEPKPDPPAQIWQSISFRLTLMPQKKKKKDSLGGIKMIREFSSSITRKNKEKIKIKYRDNS